jgi:hypothetical protein
MFNELVIVYKNNIKNKKMNILGLICSHDKI